MDAVQTPASQARDDSGSAALIDQVLERLQTRLSPEQAPEAMAFARQYYGHVAPEVLAERTPDNLYGAALSHWQFARSFAGGSEIGRAHV